MDDLIRHIKTARQNSANTDEAAQWIIDLVRKDHPTPAAEPAPVAVEGMPEWQAAVITKLMRFHECVEDGEGVDICMEWLDTLTFLGLIDRTQRSPARWEITDDGVAALYRVNLAPTGNTALVEALRWYEEQVRNCRKITPDGEAARQQLDRDGGKRAVAALSQPAAPQPTPEVEAGVYVASKAQYGGEWVAKRNEGYPIISTWIDECGKGATSDWSDLWSRCIREASSASAVVVVEREGDEPRGALVEVGAALAKGVPVFAAGVSKGTWHMHPGVTVMASEDEAFAAALARGSVAEKGER